MMMIAVKPIVLVVPNVIANVTAIVTVIAIAPKKR
jgi:hypothetical protein